MCLATRDVAAAFFCLNAKHIHHGTTNRFVLACRNAIRSVRGQRRLPADPEFSSIRLEIHETSTIFVVPESHKLCLRQKSILLYLAMERVCESTRRIL